jgi:uncharacterized protein (TIGR04255 family)
MYTKYNKAPISEVFMGVCYNNTKIPVDLILNKALFNEEFPNIGIVEPIILEVLNNFQIRPNYTPNFIPFRIRRWSSDNTWLLQIQANMIFFNWIRLDDEPVGTYAGFSTVKEKFFSILDTIEKDLKINLHNDIELCELTYYDRVKWQSEISDLSEIDKIMNINSPPKFSDDGYNNVFSRYTYHDSELNGFGFININTDTAKGGEQIIKLESNLRGNLANNYVIETWFEQAHDKQLNIFDKIFTKEIKEKWL